MEALERLRRPEYTGENRCMACTYVNVVLTVCLTAVLVAAATLLAGLVPALALGAAFAILAAGSIWLRGYLVPKTPTLTKRYLPDSVLRRFGKAPAPGPGPEQEGAAPTEESPTGEDADGDDPETFDHESLLLSAGAVEPCEEIDDLCLTDAFDRAWSAHLEDVPAEPDPVDVAASLGFDRDELDTRHYGDGTVVTEGARRIFEWPSETAMRLDAAGARALADHSPEWEQLTPPQRAALVSGLRVFVEECPDGSPAELGEEEVESCCTTHTVVTLDCTGTGDRLFEWRAS